MTLNLPFGGIQLVICGDFFQLPPFTKSLPGVKSQKPRFAFEAEAWNQELPLHFNLQAVFRQADPGSMSFELYLLVPFI